MFKRGRYVSTRLLAAAETDEATRKARHEERERFSVATIAFCIQHDKAFKHHFLSVVAGLSRGPLGDLGLAVLRQHDPTLDIRGAAHVFPRRDPIAVHRNNWGISRKELPRIEASSALHHREIDEHKVTRPHCWVRTGPLSAEWQARSRQEIQSS